MGIGERRMCPWHCRPGLALCTSLISASMAACGTQASQGGERSSGRPVDMHAPSTGSGAIDKTDNPTPASSGQGAGTTGNAGDGTGSATPSAPIGGADAGTFMPRADLDPNVTFDWQETVPGGAGSCEAGTYTGTFMCELIYDTTMPDAGSGTFVTGPITLHFEKSANGEFLELADAKLEGVGMDVFGFTADLSGELDCTTLQFTSQAQNGAYGLGLPIDIPLGTVDGTLAGMLDNMTHELNGTWTLTADGGITCVGPWHASFTP
jgi:hypothetical protein